MATKATVQPSTRFAVRSLIVLILVNIINFYDRHVPGALAEPMRKEFALSDTQIGFIGTVFTWLYAVIGLPLGALADKGSRKKLLAAGVAVWGLLTGFAAWAWSYPMLLVSRLGVAVGEATCAPTATSWIGDLFPPARRARPLALFMLGVPVGGALSFFFSGPIAQAYGWRTAMVFAGVPALLIVPVLLMLHEPQRGASEHIATPQAAGSVSQVLSIPTFWWIVVSGALVNFNLYAVGTFFPAFFGRIHHMNVARAGITTGIVYAAGGLLGGLIGGSWGDLVVGRRPDGRMRAAAIGALIAVPLSYFGIQQSAGAIIIAVPLLALAYGALNMYYGLVYASIQDIVSPALRGTTMAMYFCAMYILGASLGPLVTGRLSDYLAHRAASMAHSEKVTEAFKAVGLHEAMLVIPVLSLGLALVLWLGSRTIVRDMERSRAV
jgi:predicted MFS family arabinose efflux permease